MPGQTQQAGTGGARDVLVLVVAAAVIVLFSLLSIFLLWKRGMPEPEWTRAVYIAGGIEALAYAAAGFLFGREVHRQQASSAEERAARAEANTAQSEARLQDAEKRAAESETRGRALAAAMHSKAARTRAGAAVQPADVLDLDDLAARLYP